MTQTKKVDDVKERKETKRRESPPTKVIVRCLPPYMTAESFLEQISPVPEHDYYQFCKPDMSLKGSNPLARAYVNFVNPEDIWLFREKFDGYVFVDTKGNEHQALVEFAPFQKIPKKKGKKTDLKKGSIEQDADYQKFLAVFENPEPESVPLPESYLEEIEIREKEKSGKVKMSTPLIDYLKRKREEKKLAILRAREERKRKEIERKKQREEEKRKRKERERERIEREKERFREKEREREKDREREREKNKEESQYKLLKKPEKEKEDSKQSAGKDEKPKLRFAKDKNREKEKEREKERERQREQDRQARRDREKERQKERSKEQDKDKAAKTSEKGEFEGSSYKKYRDNRNNNSSKMDTSKEGNELSADLESKGRDKVKDKALKTNQSKEKGKFGRQESHEERKKPARERYNESTESDGKTTEGANDGKRSEATSGDDRAKHEDKESRAKNRIRNKDRPERAIYVPRRAHKGTEGKSGQADEQSDSKCSKEKPESRSRSQKSEEKEQSQSKDCSDGAVSEDKLKTEKSNSDECQENVGNETVKEKSVDSSDGDNKEEHIVKETESVDHLESADVKEAECRSQGMESTVQDVSEDVKSDADETSMQNEPKERCEKEANGTAVTDDCETTQSQSKDSGGDGQTSNLEDIAICVPDETTSSGSNDGAPKDNDAKTGDDLKPEEVGSSVDPHSDNKDIAGDDDEKGDIKPVEVKSESHDLEEVQSGTDAIDSGHEELD